MQQIDRQTDRQRYANTIENTFMTKRMNGEKIEMKQDRNKYKNRYKQVCKTWRDRGNKRQHPGTLPQHNTTHNQK
jgi:hypothetical protein